ncbi:MAG: nitroreductase family protein [Akkermansia muciniphila]
MEFYEVIEKRRSIREFQDKPIARNMLERILNAGLPPRRTTSGNGSC